MPSRGGYRVQSQLGARRARGGEGRGLGMSIVRAIANAHHATIETHARDGGGLAINVVFPPAADPATPANR